MSCQKCWKVFCHQRFKLLFWQFLRSRSSSFHWAYLQLLPIRFHIFCHTRTFSNSCIRSTNCPLYCPVCCFNPKLSSQKPEPGLQHQLAWSASFVLSSTRRGHNMSSSPLPRCFIDSIQGSYVPWQEKGSTTRRSHHPWFVETGHTVPFSRWHTFIIYCDRQYKSLYQWNNQITSYLRASWDRYACSWTNGSFNFDRT